MDQFISQLAPSEERVQIYGLPYSINKQGTIESHDREVTYYSTRWNKEVSYFVPSRKLKYDIKMSDNNIPLARVQLYPLNKGEGRKCYYVSHLVYALFNNIPYEDLGHIHYKDGNSMNMSLDNLIPSNLWLNKTTRTL